MAFKAKCGSEARLRCRMSFGDGPPGAAPRRPRWHCVLVLLLLAAVAASPARAEEGLRLRTQLWDFFQWNADGSQTNKLDVRLYQDLALGGGWSLTLREDLPVLTTSKPGTDNPEGAWRTGIGDAFVQALFTTPEVLPATSLQVGFRLLFPTGGLSPFGGGTYQFGPMAAINYHLPEVAEGLVLSPTARYMMSFAKADPKAKQVRQLQLYPRAELKLADRWSLGLWVENPMLFDRLTGDWFVPLDVMVTYDVAKHVVLRLGGATALVDSLPQYNHMVYGRLSFSF